MEKCPRPYCSGILLRDWEEADQLKCNLCSRSFPLPVKRESEADLELRTRRISNLIGAEESATYLRVRRETVWRMAARRELHYWKGIRGFSYEPKEIIFTAKLHACGFRLRYNLGTLAPPKVIATIAILDGQPLTPQAVNYELRTGILEGTQYGNLRYGFAEAIKKRWPNGFQQFIGSVSNASLP